MQSSNALIKSWVTEAPILQEIILSSCKLNGFLLLKKGTKLFNEEIKNSLFL